tara:strand:+ start:134 stop:379 length:246 start_codon:yes stop_codon:yes gene_type:complete
MATPQTKEDFKQLCRELSSAAHRKDGVELGNICHKLRCRYGLKYDDLWKAANLLPVDFDELVRQWDDADMDFAMHKKDLSF